MSFRKKIFALNFSGFLLFLIDRWLRKLVLYSSDFGLGRKFFKLDKNYDLAFGLPVFPAGGPLNRIIICCLSAVILLILIFLLVKSYEKKNVFLIGALTLIILGAVGNLLDRLRYGFVTDYFNVPFFTAFNLADAMIVFGVGLLMIKILKPSKS